MKPTSQMSKRLAGDSMAEDYLVKGIAAVKAGNKQEARQLLIEALRIAPNDERSWGWFFNVCESDEERLRCIKEILRINPNNEKAKQKYDELMGLGYQTSEVKVNQSNNQPPTTTTSPVKKPRKWYMSTEVKILTFLFLTPLWTAIVLDDPDSSTGVKVLAIILLVIYILIICNLLNGNRLF